jgi:uncharacterized protein (DUF849 family)
MTFAALQTIHYLLTSEKYKAEKVLELRQYNYDEEFEQFVNETGCNAKAAVKIRGRAVTAELEEARNNLAEITEALQQFDAHDWR